VSAADLGGLGNRLAPDLATGAWSLYVTSIDGTLCRLRPPPGVDLIARETRPPTVARHRSPW
jgi:hypothetical protein